MDPAFKPLTLLYRCAAEIPVEMNLGLRYVSSIHSKHESMSDNKPGIKALGYFTTRCTSQIVDSVKISFTNLIAWINWRKSMYMATVIPHDDCEHLCRSQCTLDNGFRYSIIINCFLF
jgi:hypothetical protein